MNSSFPYSRGRRLRSSTAIRSMVAEHEINASDLIAPLFVIEGVDKKESIASMPGYYRYSLDLLTKEAEALFALGIPAVLLFVRVPDDKKDSQGTEALNPDGLMQQAVKTLKDRLPDLCVMTDVALDPYSSDGHDGIVEDGKIINDVTLKVLEEMALSHARSGADFVAPSDMMDGRVRSIRKVLEEQGFHNTGIMAYSAKYASCFYGPFRDALDSSPGFGDKKTYQMNPANVKEAIREAKMDEQEGADIIMVKPGIPYLDVVRAVVENVSVPVASYHVSGEYAMIKAAAEKGWLDEQTAILESIIAFKRAGASLITTYFAKDIGQLLD
ncbi:MAG: porphobilinogen synthase [Balneolales bacterium]